MCIDYPTPKLHIEYPTYVAYFIFVQIPSMHAHLTHFLLHIHSFHIMLPRLTKQAISMQFKYLKQPLTQTYQKTTHQIIMWLKPSKKETIHNPNKRIHLR